VGSFRQRARNAERTSRVLKEQRRQKVAVRTHEAIQEFEEHLRTVQESLNGAIDDLPMDADAGHLRDHARRSILDKANRLARDDGSEASSTAGGRPRNRTSHSFIDSGNTRSQGSIDVDPRFDRRPPSPLHVYDYGCISSKARSTWTQKVRAGGEPARPLHRQSSVGFYFPGAESRQGPYGSHLLDPIHMPPRGWEPYKTSPNRWPKDPGEVRPATTEALEYKHRRTRGKGPFTSEIVRSTSTHDQRALLASMCLDKRNEDKQLEQVRFEHGFFEGKWRDPLLDPATAIPTLSPWPAPRCDFLAAGSSDETARGDVPPAQKLAAKILFGVEEVMCTSRSNLQKIFLSVNRGTIGALEPTEFLEGLVKLHVLSPDEATVDDIVVAMAYVDPQYDGRVNFSMLERAVSCARSARRDRQRDQRRRLQSKVKRMTSSYDSLSIDIVKVDQEPKSLYDFNRSFDRFRKQQKDLLAIHGENKF